MTVALLDLCKTVHTAQSLFVVGAVVALRDEDVVRERATAVAGVLEPLLSDPTVDFEQAPSDPFEAVYRLLTAPLTDQRRRWASASNEWRSSLTSTIRSERDRLRSLARESSASTGSYPHYLRHKLADLILVSGVGDDLGEWAYRLLQLRTEELEELRPLLREIPEEGRERFISWVLTPRKDAPVDRIRFLLGLASEEFPEDLDIEALQVIATAADPGVAADALVVACQVATREPSRYSTRITRYRRPTCR